MTFLVSLIALLIERFFDCSHLRNWAWFSRYKAYILQKLSIKLAFLLLIIILLPVLLLIIGLQWLMIGVLYGFVSLIFQLLILIYCLGPQNFWADAFACISTMSQDDPAVAQDKIKNKFSPTNSYTQSLHQHFLNMIFVEANRRVFAVVVWYVILGPAGAVLYRMVTLCASNGLQNKNERLSHFALKVEAVLNWFPVRLLIFFFALAGHFVLVCAKFRKVHSWYPADNEMLLEDCGIAAIGCDEITDTHDCLIEKNAVGLIDRACILLLVVTFIIYLIS